MRKANITHRQRLMYDGFFLSLRPSSSNASLAFEIRYLHVLKAPDDLLRSRFSFYFILWCIVEVKCVWLKRWCLQIQLRAWSWSAPMKLLIWSLDVAVMKFSHSSKPGDKVGVELKSELCSGFEMNNKTEWKCWSGCKCGNWLTSSKAVVFMAVEAIF